LLNLLFGGYLTSEKLHYFYIGMKGVESHSKNVPLFQVIYKR